MNRIFLSILLFFGIQSQTFSQLYEIPDDIKRIVFLGNSITYQGNYISYIDAYFTLNYPEKQYKFINVGLPSETVSGLSETNHAGGKFPRPDLHERLHRVLKQTQPDLVFACYGMNDGIYLPLDKKRFKKYKKGIIWLNNEIKNRGAEIIHVTPPIYDERKGEAYANVLDIYADWLKSKRYTSGWKVIDIHWPMKKKLEDYRLQDSTFVFAKDGVHPNELGHFIMAKQILLQMGETVIQKSNSVDEFISNYKNGKEILELVIKRHQISKDAWLTSTRHKRPGMNKGLPLEVAQQKLKIIDDEINLLLENKN